MPRSRANARDRPHFRRVERLAGHPAHRRLDRDRADRHRDPHLRRARRRLLDFGQGNRRAPRRQRHQRQPAEMLGAVAFVIPQMAFLLHQHPPPAPLASACAPRDGWPSVPVGRNTAALLAEQRRHPLFEFGDDPAARIIIDLDAAPSRRSPPAAAHIPPATGRARPSGTARPHRVLLPCCTLAPEFPDLEARWHSTRFPMHDG